MWWPLPVPKAWPEIRKTLFEQKQIDKSCPKLLTWQDWGRSGLYVYNLEQDGFCTVKLTFPFSFMTVMRRWKHCFLYSLELSGISWSTFTRVIAWFVTLSAVAWQQPVMQNIGSSFHFWFSKGTNSIISLECLDRGCFNIISWKHPSEHWTSLHSIHEFSWISTSFSDTSAHPLKLDPLAACQPLSAIGVPVSFLSCFSGRFFSHGSTRLTELHPPTYREHHAASGFGSRSTSRTSRCLSYVGKSDKLKGM